MMPLAHPVAGLETAFQFRALVLLSRAMSEELTAANLPLEVARPAASSSVPAAHLSDPTTWVEQHGDYLFRYALIRVRNETVAEDLVQDALLAAFQGREQFSGQFTERSWLTGILKHKILDHFRRQARERTVMADDALPTELEGRCDDLGLWKHAPETGPADWGADAGTQMERKEFMAALKQCLAKLPPRQADAFVLREMDAVDSEQIQETLVISPDNFWVLLHRAWM